MITVYPASTFICSHANVNCYTASPWLILPFLCGLFKRKRDELKDIFATLICRGIIKKIIRTYPQSLWKGVE